MALRNVKLFRRFHLHFRKLFFASCDGATNYDLVYYRSNECRSGGISAPWMLLAKLRGALQFRAGPQFGGYCEPAL
jgi:hypothetical protein